MDSVIDQGNAKAVKCPRDVAQQTVATWALAVLLQEYQCWSNPPMPSVHDDDNCTG